MFRGAIIENTFTGISEMADSIFPFLKLIPTIKMKMLKIHWDSLSKVKQFKTDMPILFISGDADTFVPTEQTIKLHAACASSNKDLWIVKGGNHNDTWLIGGEDYHNKLSNFFKANRLDRSKLTYEQLAELHDEKAEASETKKA